MKRKFKLLAAVLGVTAIITVGAVALAAAGDSTDPLVTLSYLNDVFAPSLRTQVDEAVSANEEALKNELDAAIAEWDERLQSETEDGELEATSQFQVITISKGQRIVGKIGCEFLLRVGSAVCRSSGTTGLIDCTDAVIISDGDSLVKNHLYMVTINTRTVEATSSVVKVLVRGDYTIE